MKQRHSDLTERAASQTHCTKCGKKKKQGATFCVGCGEPVTPYNTNFKIGGESLQHQIKLEYEIEGTRRKGTAIDFLKGIAFSPTYEDVYSSLDFLMDIKAGHNDFSSSNNVQPPGKLASMREVYNKQLEMASSALEGIFTCPRAFVNASKREVSSGLNYTTPRAIEKMIKDVAGRTGESEQQVMKKIVENYKHHVEVYEAVLECIEVQKRASERMKTGRLASQLPFDSFRSFLNEKGYSTEVIARLKIEHEKNGGFFGLAQEMRDKAESPIALSRAIEIVQGN